MLGKGQEGGENRLGRSSFLRGRGSGAERENLNRTSQDFWTLSKKRGVADRRERRSQCPEKTDVTRDGKEPRRDARL